MAKILIQRGWESNIGLDLSWIGCNSRPMRYVTNHGVYLGYIDNPGASRDWKVNEFLKRKTVGVVSRSTCIASENFDQPKPTSEKEYVHYVFRDLKHALRWSLKANTNVQWLVLFAAGTVLDKKQPFHLWLDQLPPADNTSIAAYAHLLVPEDGSYFRLNTQMLAINVCALRENGERLLDWLHFEGEREVELSMTKSKGDFHDGYTPHWVAFEKNARRTTKVDATSAWLAQLINAGYSAMNISGETMRQTKKFFYMDEPDQIELGKNYLLGRDRHLLLQQAEGIGKGKVMSSFLSSDSFDYNYCLIQNTCDYGFDELPHARFDAVAIPAAGFNLMHFQRFIGHSDITFYHYDISPMAVSVRQKLVEEWSGAALSEFLGRWRETKVAFIGEPGDVTFADWANVQAAEHRYETIDLMVDWQALLEKIKSEGHTRVLFDISNILSYHETIYKYGFDRATRVFKKIVDFMNRNFADWCLRSDHFSLSKQVFDLCEREDFIARGIGRSAYGYFVYKSAVSIPIGPYAHAWENASIEFEPFFKDFPEKTFRIKMEKAFEKRPKHERWNWAEFYKQSYLHAVKLDLSFDHAKMLDEARRAHEAGLFTSHRHEEQFGWSSFVIHGLGFGKTQSYESYFPGEVAPADAYNFVDEAREHCPTIVKYFESEFPKQAGTGKFSRIRIMALAPGGFIPPHWDSYASSCPGPINIALNNPRNCHFHMWKGSNYTRKNYLGLLPFNEGVALNIDVGNSHLVYNLSNEVRFHLIAHLEMNEDSRQVYGEFRTRSLKKFFADYGHEVNS